MACQMESHLRGEEEDEEQQGNRRHETTSDIAELLGVERGLGFGIEDRVQLPLGLSIDSGLGLGLGLGLGGLGRLTLLGEGRFSGLRLLFLKQGEMKLKQSQDQVPPPPLRNHLGPGQRAQLTP